METDMKSTLAQIPFKPSHAVRTSRPHRPACCPPSPPREERAGERRPFHTQVRVEDWIRKPRNSRNRSLSWLLLSLALIAANSVFAAEDMKSNQEKEAQLISLLRSNAPPADKAIACKQLVLVGSEKAVPALAALLSDESLA